jgi:hypothetical protein
MGGHLARVGDIKIHTKFEDEKLKGRGHLEDRRMSGREIKIDITKQGVDWIQLGLDMVQWRSFVNMIINLVVPNSREFCDQPNNYKKDFSALKLLSCSLLCTVY